VKRHLREERSGEAKGYGALPRLHSRRLRSLAGFGSLALIGSVLAGTALLASPAYAAAGDPFPAADPLVFVAQGAPTGLEEAVTDSSGAVSFQPEGPAASVTYNAIGYNTADNYLYGIVSTGNASIPTNSLIRIGQGGVITRVGSSVYNQAPPWNVGAFGGDGLYYIAASTSVNTVMLGLNPTTGAIARTVTLSAPIAVSDMTYANGYFWGEAPGAVAQIARVNPANGAVNFFPAPFFANGPTDPAGAAWTFGNGSLGFSQNVSGTVTQVAVTNPAAATPTFTLVAQSPGPASGNNDGAASPGQPTDLSIVKTGPQALVPATTVTYELTVTNNGPGNSSGFTVNDTVPAPLTNVASPDAACTVTGSDVRCVGGRTLAGDSVSYTITATVPASGATAAVANTATVTSNEKDPTPGNNTSTTTAEPAGLSVVKHAGTPVDVNGDGLVDAGDTIQYTFDVTNTGSVPLTQVGVDDPKVGSATCAQTTLAPGAATTCSADAVYTITTDDMNTGAVNNSATASGTTPDNTSITSGPSTTSTPTTAPAPGITVVKSADPSDADSFTPGQTITYHFTVTNTGNVPLNDVNVVEGAFTGTGTMSNPPDCPSSTLEPNAQEVCSATYVLTQDDVNAGSVTNTAAAEGTPTESGTPITSTPSTVTVPTPAAPGITVVKSANPSTVTAAGQTVTYSFVVTNTGNVTLTDVGVKDTDFSGSDPFPSIDCPTTTLVAGQVETCTATYTVTQDDVNAGTLTNTADVVGTPPDGTPLDPVPSNPVTVTIPASPALSIVKTADVQAAAAGEKITYTFTVTNTGNVTITDPQVNDTGFTGSDPSGLSSVVCPTGPITLAPGQVETCTATYTVTQADVDAGSISNAANVIGNGPDGDPIPPVTSVPVNVPTNPHPALSLAKTASSQQATTVGQVITYTFAVTNTGNVTVHDPKVNEGAFTGHGTLSAVKCPSTTTLAPGQELDCTGTYTVVAADLTGGTLSNTATVTGTTPGGDPITSDPSTAKVAEVAPPAPAGLALTGSDTWTAGLVAFGLLVLGLLAAAAAWIQRRNHAKPESDS
jgi:uncharacterized repeat protein (TIGR01451 family)